MIWTCYFDEGVGGHKFGKNGLLALDADGNIIYDLPKEPHHQTVWWVCSLNIDSNSSIWMQYVCCESQLLHLVDHQVVGHWIVPLEGGWGLAVGDGLALIVGDRDDPDTVRLFELSNSKELKQVAELELLDESRQRIRSEWGAERGDALYLLPKNGIVYKFDIGMTTGV